MALKIANLKQQTFFASYEENTHLPEPERQRTAWREAYGRWSPFRPHVVRVLVAKWDAHVAEEAASVQETPPHPRPKAQRVNGRLASLPGEKVGPDRRCSQSTARSGSRCEPRLIQCSLAPAIATDHGAEHRLQRRAVRRTAKSGNCQLPAR